MVLYKLYVLVNIGSKILVVRVVPDSPPKKAEYWLNPLPETEPEKAGLNLSL
jgi:hypothetical protein